MMVSNSLILLVISLVAFFIAFYPGWVLIGLFWCLSIVLIVLSSIAAALCLPGILFTAVGAQILGLPPNEHTFVILCISAAITAVMII